MHYPLPALKFFNYTIISSYACSPETAAIDFEYTLDHCREKSSSKAYHIIQAFAPSEVNFEEAHQLGKELADKVLEGKYSYIVTTHNVTISSAWDLPSESTLRKLIFGAA